MKKIFLVLMSCGTLIIMGNSASLRAQQTDDVIVQIDEIEVEVADFDDDIFGYEFDVNELDQDATRKPADRGSLFMQTYGLKLLLLGLTVKQYCFTALDYCLNNEFVNYLISGHVKHETTR